MIKLLYDNIFIVEHNTSVFSLAELFLEPNDLQKLIMFEERCVDSYLREKDTLLHATQEEQIRVMGDR